MRSRSGRSGKGDMRRRVRGMGCTSVGLSAHRAAQKQKAQLTIAAPPFIHIGNIDRESDRGRLLKVEVVNGGGLRVCECRRGRGAIIAGVLSRPLSSVCSGVYAVQTVVGAQNTKRHLVGTKGKVKLAHGAG